MEAIVFVARHTIRPGAMAEVRAQCRQMAEFIEANHPRHLLLQFYFDDAASEMTTLQVHPDEASFALHLRLGAQSGHFAGAYDNIESSKIAIYGDLSDELAAQVSQIGQGNPVEIQRDSVGFERLSATPA